MSETDFLPTKEQRVEQARTYFQNSIIGADNLIWQKQWDMATAFKLKDKNFYRTAVKGVEDARKLKELFEDALAKLEATGELADPTTDIPDGWADDEAPAEEAPKPNRATRRKTSGKK